VRAAFANFSTLPVGRGTAPEAETIAFLPLVGAVVGALAGTAGWAVTLVAPHVLGVAIAFGLSILLTGALHIDGFLDICDAVFASVPVQRRLEILKDPHHGTFAVAFFAVLCVVWLAALATIDPPRLPLALAFASCASRWIAVGIAFVVPYGAAGVQPPRAIHAAMGLLTLALGWSYWGHAVVLIALGGVTFAAAFRLKSRLGGVFNGDCYGFLIACTEVAILAALPLTSP
jgi:adenosylcobinamide-GDP ribazoletransferase